MLLEKSSQGGCYELLLPLALSCTDQLRHLTLCILRAESKTTRSRIFISMCLLSQYSLRLVSLDIKSAFIFLAFWSHSTCHLYTSFSCPLGCCPVLPSFSTGTALFFPRPSFSSWSLARAPGTCFFPSSGRCSQLGFASCSSGGITTYSLDILFQSLSHQSSPKPPEIFAQVRCRHHRLTCPNTKDLPTAKFLSPPTSEAFK